MLSKRLRRAREAVIYLSLFSCAIVSVITTFAIVFTLIAESLSFFEEVSLVEFLTGTQWTPLFTIQHFGVLPLLGATMLISVLAMLVAVPLGLLAAIYLSEYAPSGLRAVVKPVLEVLAGIPTVVYGYFALTFLTPNVLRGLFTDIAPFNALAASIAMGIMILPLVSSLSEDAMRAVPQSLREGAYGLGANRFEVATRVVVPAALSGIVAASILAMSRAVGETMIVAIAAGNQPNLSWNPLEGMQAMTAYIVQVSLGDTPRGSVEYDTIFAVGILLFAVTLLLNIGAQWFLSRFREEYE
ncbi:MAG: phosphate ABC transporter permease subunit PstC [Dehalococcoidia bacterium]